MDVWKLLEQSSAQHSIQYRKWLDVNSSHFFYIIPSDLASYSEQKKIAQKQIESYQESGTYLLYLSLEYYIENENGLIPIFLSPAYPNVLRNQKSIEWHLYSSLFSINPLISSEPIQIEQTDIASWINSTTLYDIKKITTLSPSIFFNLNMKQYIHRDIQLLRQRKENSQGIDSLFNDNIKLNTLAVQASYLDYTHILPLDQSQAEAIAKAEKSSIVISGPPGTGKSQTLIHLAFEEIIKGKKVAIIAQKKAALDVVEKRWNQLGLQNFSLVLKNDIPPEQWLEDIEKSLYSIQAYSNQLTQSFNIVYYKHCIRTLEDYFDAARKYSNRKTLTYSQKLDKYSEDIYQCIYPKTEWINLALNELQIELSQLQKLLTKTGIEWENIDFGLIYNLYKPFQILNRVDIISLKKILTQKNSQILNQRIEKELKKHIATQPFVRNKLYSIQKEKINHLISYYNQKIHLPLFLDNKAKWAIEEVKSLVLDWEKLNVWERLNELNLALSYQDWENKYNQLLVNRKEFENKTYHSIPSELVQYISNKLSSKLPEWIFAQTYWINKPLANTTKLVWQQIFQTVEKLIQNNSDFGKINILDFIHNFNFSTPLEWNKIEWQELCGRNYTNTQWNQQRIKQEPNIKIEPVLKNYSRREIALMAQYIRKYYTNFSSYNLAHNLHELYQSKHLELKNILSSRKQQTKEERDNWKKSIHYINKTWSQKRKKPSLFSFINEIDFNFLQWLKPLTISTIEDFSRLIPLEKEIYDTLIIDESSQIEWLDILPALYRAKKIIIVGDSKQLAPTRFFRNLYHLNAIEQYESLLELAEEKLPIYSLQWHYRSQFNSLISYSNQNFYQNKLYTTPKDNPQAIQWKYLPNGVYYQRKNKNEVKEIVAILKDICIEASNKNLSIGVICFSIQQKEAIEEEIETTLIHNPQWNEFISNNSMESFFVKSIEQVQGDERDIILISSGYGKNNEGKFYQFFGPILGYKGENRLNVLMSRARKQIYFISSIQSTDIQVKPNASKGLILFKKLFEFLELNHSQANCQKLSYDTYWSYFLNPFRK